MTTQTLDPKLSIQITAVVDAIRMVYVEAVEEKNWEAMIAAKRILAGVIGDQLATVHADAWRYGARQEGN